MTIYIFAIYMFFIFMLGKNAYAIDIKQATNSIKAETRDNHLWVSDSKPSDLPLEPLGTADGEGLNSYRFFRVTYQDKLFAFQRTSSSEQQSDMFVWVSADKGISWAKTKTTKCILDEAGGKCDVMSSMIVNNELVVIYANTKQHVIAKSADGENWKVGQAIDRDSMADKDIVYYSGIPSDIPEFKDENKYVACYKSDEEPDKKKKDGYVTTAVCASSDDADGTSWKPAFYMLINDSISQSIVLDQISFFQEDAYFIANTDSEKDVLFICRRQSKPDTKSAAVMQCEPTESDPQGRIPVFDINCDKDSSTIVIKSTDAYTLGYMSEKHSAAGDILKIKGQARAIEKRDLRTAVVEPSDKGKKATRIEEVDGDKPILFRIVYVTESALSVMYEYEKKIFNISSAVKQGSKRGCVFIKEQNKKQEAKSEDDEYTKTIFYDEIDSESQKFCPLENFEPADNDTHVSFFIKVPSSVDFENSENCFKHSHVEEEDNESAKHRRSIIKIKNIIEFNDDPNNKMKEIEFVYPASLHNLMKYDKAVACIAKNFKFTVAYMFKGDENVVKRMKFDTLVKDFTVEDNRLSLQDYAWNDSIPKTTTGSYVVDSTNYMKRFQVYVDLLNNKPNAVADFNDFVSKFPKEMYQYIVLSEEDATEQYAGVDFTNSSKHYAKFEIDVTEDSVLSTKVIVPEKGIIVGLICPLEDSDSLGELHCFDEVIDMEDNRVLFEQFAADIPFSILPKIMVYNQKAMGVESLLRLDTESYKALNNLVTGIQFRCECKVNTHKVTIKFAIGTASSEFPEGTDIEPVPGPIPLPSKSARNILSSAVVLLVLLNVFSCTSFLN